jgi:hypothetical protein
MKAVLIGAVSLIAITMAVGAQERPHKLPKITVHPRRPYEVTVEPGEYNEWRVRQWIEHCKPFMSDANNVGIRHYLFANPNPACPFGVTAD